MSQREQPAQRRQLDPETDIELGGIKSADLLRPARKAKGSKYDDLIDFCTKLKPGQVYEVIVFDEEDLEAARERIAAAVRRYAQPRTPFRLTTRLTIAGTVGIYCTKD